MELQNDTNDVKYINLLDKQYSIIRCNIEGTLQQVDHISVMSTSVNINGGLEDGDASKEAFLRQMSNTNDPELDIYSADGNETRPRAEDVEMANTSNSQPNVVATLLPEPKAPAPDVPATVNSTVAEEITEVVRPAGYLQEPEGSETEQQDSMETPTDIEDVITLALSLGDAFGEQEFQYEADDIDETAPETEVATSNNESTPEVDTESQARLTESDDIVAAPTHIEQSASSVDAPVNDAGFPPPEEDILPPEYDENPQDSLASISGKLDILDYAQSEWKGTTYTAKCLRNGYKQLINKTGCNFMRQVRGDNYCALRATAFQILTQNIEILRSCSNWDEYITSLPERLQQEHGCDWLNEWTFAERLSSDYSNRTEVMHDCLSFFVDQKKLSKAMSSDSDRQAHFSALFNSGSTAEIKLFEAIKLLMLDQAVKLHAANDSGQDVPVFSWLLFARDTSEDPHSLMMNHLNPAGKTGGLEQVEMCLLGQCLEVTMRVVRPSNVEQEDFITHYPDHMINEWAVIDLIAEDDRHYNIAVR